jgi:hypothetical protein
VDQCGGVEGVAVRLLRHACGRELPQLVVDEREQVRGGIAVTSRAGIEQASLPGRSADHNNPQRGLNGKSAAELPSDQ